MTQAISETNTTTNNDLTTFLDESSTTPELIFKEQNVKASEAAFRSVPETVGSMEALMQKSTFLGNAVWTTANNRSDILTTLTLPRAFKYNPIKMVLNNYTFIGGDLHLSIRFNGTPFHQGRLILYWCPLALFDVTIYRATGMASVEIDASTNITQQIKIPFAHIQSVMDTFNVSLINDFGVFVVKVLNPLLASVGSDTSLDLMIYGHFENAKIYNPSVDHLYAQSFVDEISTAVETATHVAGMLGEMGLFLDHPATVLPSSERVVQDTTHGEGGVASMTLDLKQGLRTFHPSEYYHTSADEMDLKQLVKIPTLFQQQVWAVGQTAKTLLFSVSVEPHSFKIDDGTRHFPTILNYLSYGFQRWRGSLKFTLDVVCTMFHRGQLACVYVPSETALLDFEQAIANPQYVFDLKSAHQFLIDIPYTSNTPYKLTQSVGGTPNTLSFYSTGRLYFFVLNPLSNGGNAPTNVEINVKVAGGDDFEFSFPRPTPTFTAESAGIDNTTVATRIDAMDSDPATFTTQTKGELFNSHMNLKSLLGRPVFKFSILNHNTDNNQFEKIFSIINRIDDGGEVETFAVDNYLKFFGHMYFFFRGSFRIWYSTTIGASASSQTALQVRLCSLNDTNNNFAPNNQEPCRGYFSHFTHGGAKPINCYDTPFISPLCRTLAVAHRFENPYPPFVYATNVVEGFVNYADGNNGIAPYFRIYQSLGDDALLSYFVGVPTMINPVQLE